MRTTITNVMALVSLAAGLCLAGCGGSRSRPGFGISSTPSDKPVAGRASLGMVVPIPGADACIIPFAVESEKGWFDDRDPFTRGGRASRVASYSAAMDRTIASNRSVRWHNALITRFSDGQSHQVLDTRGVISRHLMFGRYDDDGAFSVETMVFIVTTDDTNHDGLLNDNDASRAILTNADGTKILPVTPPGGQVWGVVRGDTGGRLYFRVVHDTNADERFNEADAATIYTWAPGMGPAQAAPAVKAAQVEAMERLLR